jgi:hypothetical protein
MAPYQVAGLCNIDITGDKAGKLERGKAREEKEYKKEKERCNEVLQLLQCTAC